MFIARSICSPKQFFSAFHFFWRIPHTNSFVPHAIPKSSCKRLVGVAVADETRVKLDWTACSTV